MYSLSESNVELASLARKVGHFVGEDFCKLVLIWLADDVLNFDFTGVGQPEFVFKDAMHELD